MRALGIAACAGMLISIGACQTNRSGYPLLLPEGASRIETKRQMLDRYGVPTLALRENDHWLYAYHTSDSKGVEVGFGPGGILGGVGQHHTTTDVLQFRVSDEGQVQSVTTLFSPAGDDGAG